MQIEQGSVVKGKVTGLTDFGAFVELEGGKTGSIFPRSQRLMSRISESICS